MWPIGSTARVAKCVLFLLLTLSSPSAGASSRQRYFCDSDALTHQEAIGRLAWAWVCGLDVCTGSRETDWNSEQAIEACGYPVFNEPTPVYSVRDEITGDLVCHLGTDPEASPSSAYFPGDDLPARLSRLKVEAYCRPVAETTP